MSPGNLSDSDEKAKNISGNNLCEFLNSTKGIPLKPSIAGPYLNRENLIHGFRIVFLNRQVNFFMKILSNEFS